MKQTLIETLEKCRVLAHDGYFTNIAHGEYQAVIGRTIFARSNYGKHEIIIIGWNDLMAKEKPCTIRWKRLSEKGNRLYGILPIDKVTILRAQKLMRVVSKKKKYPRKQWFKKGYTPWNRGIKRA